MFQNISILDLAEQVLSLQTFYFFFDVILALTPTILLNAKGNAIGKVTTDMKTIAKMMVWWRGLGATWRKISIPRGRDRGR